ncbi:hypothetical protein C8F01DRAFT_1243759 [Mycena amicta]|nr:hypothetical protein C8F01DRAFT_1243759 [Mycena amicta]
MSNNQRRSPWDATQRRRPQAIQSRSASDPTLRRRPPAIQSRSARDPTLRRRPPAIQPRAAARDAALQHAPPRPYPNTRYFGLSKIYSVWPRRQGVSSETHLPATQRWPTKTPAPKRLPTVAPSPKEKKKTPRRPLVDDGLLDHIQTILGSDTALPPCTPSQLNLMLQALTLRSQQQLVEVTREDARLRESQENQRLDLQARAVALAGRTCEAQENLAAAQTAMVDRLEGLVSAQQDAANAADSLAKATSDLHQTLTALLFATHPELFTQ